MAGSQRGSTTSPLPASLIFIERDWLSSNHLIGFNGGELRSDASGNARGSGGGSGSGRTSAVIVDTGYGSRSDLTVALVERALRGSWLERIINTHAHSDHVGGNAALQARHGCRIQVPEGAADALREADDSRLHYASLGQVCPAFQPDETYRVGDRLVIGDLTWDVHGSPGHDNDSLVLHEPSHGLLVSGDALWENGFGLLFPVFFDEPAFEHQAETLARIAALKVNVVIPGHGPVFGDAAAALERATRRLTYLRDHPDRHAWLALKVALSFVLLDRRSVPLETLAGDFGRLELVERINARYLGWSPDRLATTVRDELVAAGAAHIDGDRLVAAGAIAG